VKKKKKAEDRLEIVPETMPKRRGRDAWELREKKTSKGEHKKKGRMLGIELKRHHSKMLEGKGASRGVIQAKDI